MSTVIPSAAIRSSRSGSVIVISMCWDVRSSVMKCGRSHRWFGGWQRSSYWGRSSTATIGMSKAAYTSGGRNDLMAQSISTYLNIPARDFAVTGAFDAVLEVDSKLFIDPHLLRFTTAPELANSYQKMLDHFSEVIKLLAHSTRRGDK